MKDFSSPNMKPSDRLEAIYELADYCIDLLQQNEEHHGEVKMVTLKYSEYYMELTVEQTLEE